MPVTYNLIASNTLTSSAASVTFSAIPNSYTDLVLKCSVRGTVIAATTNQRNRFNADTGSNYSQTDLYGNNSVAASGRSTSITIASSRGTISGSTSTSNTFGNLELYFPNYNSTSSKPFSMFGASEDNSATTPYITATANLYVGTSAITEILIYPQSNNLEAGSSFFLYGIKNS